MNTSTNIRRQFDFDFGTIPLPARSIQRTGRMSQPPEHMTANDHQLIGEYQKDLVSVKITYNHTRFVRELPNGSTEVDTLEHKLINPFVIRVGRGVSTKWLIREAPDRLYVLEKDKSPMVLDRIGQTADRTFAFNSIYNLFDHCVCGNGSVVLRFGQDRIETWKQKKLLSSTVYDRMNPLTCRVGGVFYLADLTTMMLIEIADEQLSTSAFELSGLPEQTCILLNASKFYQGD